MLFKKEFLTLIEQGKVQTAFRKWRRPSVSESGTLLTSVGQLRIKSIEQIKYEQITDDEILNAGYKNRAELDKEFSFKEEGDIYKIQFEFEQADPRIELSENTDISDNEMNEIHNKLMRYDSHGKVKNWTLKILETIHVEPGKNAVDYAAKLGYEKEWFKLNIRKLKNLGLTISLTDGYDISPRGKVVLKKIQQHIAKKG